MVAGRFVDAGCCLSPSHSSRASAPREVSGKWLLPLFSLVLGFTVSPALAHVADGPIAAGFSSGFLHPFAGLDHVAAMLAVGLWGAVLGPPALWLLPVLFPLIMAFGGLLGAGGFAIPHIEAGIALSAIVLGGVVAGAVRLPLVAAASIVAAFAIFHGHAHGAELPRNADARAYSAGFVVATGLLHLVGIALSLIGRWPAGEKLVRAGGVAIALAGAVFLRRWAGAWF